uniref:Transposase n=1 Tax=Panagrolaimus sp. JU765 TaxID=591449 RepID=A0AC34RLD5_9BILA
MLIVEAVKSGRKQKDVAAQFHCSPGTVCEIMKKYHKRQGLEDKKRSGRPRKTTAALDRIITRKSKSDIKKNAVEIAREMAEEFNVKVSRQTIGRRLNAAGLFGRVPIKKPWISAKNRRARIEFAKAHVDWSIEQWKKVIWSDESKFQLFGSDGRRYIRRPSGARNNQKYQKPTIKHGGGNVLVWGCFSSSGVGPIRRIEGIMDSIMYRDIMENTMLPFARQTKIRGWVYMQDNDPKHRSRLVQQWFLNRKVRLMEWPSQSPDLNPIEHLWNELGKRVGARTHRNQDELFEDLQREWRAIPLNVLTNLVESMPRRCAEVLKCKGYAVKY